MKRWTATAAILASVVSTGTAVWFTRQRLEKDNEQVGVSHRQIVYQSILQSYNTSFSNGMTRTQIEDSLRTRGVQFSDICCLETGESSSDITKIGFETGPWYCTGVDYYVAFHFTGPLGSRNPKDALTKISIQSLPVDCL